MQLGNHNLGQLIQVAQIAVDIGNKHLHRLGQLRQHRLHQHGQQRHSQQINRQNRKPLAAFQLVKNLLLKKAHGGVE